MILENFSNLNDSMKQMEQKIQSKNSINSFWFVCSTIYLWAVEHNTQGRQ